MRYFFSQPAKRKGEFKEFRDFTYTPNHRIFKFYGIRWLSFGACVRRILEVFFSKDITLLTEQRCLRRQQRSLDPCSTSLTLLFLIMLFTSQTSWMQPSRATIRSVYVDYMSGCKSVLSCFMQKQFLRCTDEEICHLDPSEIFSHVELKQMYLGIKTAKIMTEPEFTNKPSAAQLDVLQRCKNFLIALPEELQRRLPINQLMKYLEILNPTVVISGDIPILPPILTKLPSIISKNLQQDLDPQWRQLPLTSVIVDMVT